MKFDPKHTIETSREFILDLQRGRTESSWNLFYERYARLVMGYAIRRGCTQAMAEDILQEVMLAMWRCMPNFHYDRKRGRFRSYLFTIVHNKIVDAFRRNKRYVDRNVEDDELITKTTDTADWDNAFDAQILREATAYAIRKTNLKTFEAFRLSYIENRKVNEVSEILGLSPKNVSQHKYSVQKLIVKEAKRLKEEYGE